MSPVYYTDLGISYDFSTVSVKRMQGYVNVGNLFDKAPPLLPALGNPGLSYPTQRSLYDVIGRDYTVGLRFTF